MKLETQTGPLFQVVLPSLPRRMVWLGLALGLGVLMGWLEVSSTAVVLILAFLAGVSFNWSS